MSSSTPIRGRMVLWAAIGMNFFCGLAYIWSMIGKALRESLHWSSIESTLPYTVFSVSFSAAMALAGPIQDRRGPRFVATIGAALIGGGMLLTGFALRPLPMIITFGVMTGLGIGSIYSATVPPALKWFHPSRKGLINGTVVAMVALASLMYSPLANRLLGSIGIAATFWSFGIGLAIVLTALAQLLRNPPPGYAAPAPSAAAPPSKAAAAASDGAATAKPAGSAAARPDIGPREALWSARFYQIWIMFAFAATTGLMITGQAANIAKSQARWEGGFVLVILIALFNAVGRLGGGALSDKIGRPNLMRLMFAVQAVDLLLFRFLTDWASLSVGVAVAGACYGAAMVVFSASVSDLFGLGHFGANYGLVYTAWGTGGVLALVAAAIYDATKSFDLAYLALGGLAVAALAVSLVFRIEPRAPRAPG